jgi:hypothetical protein
VGRPASAIHFDRAVRWQSRREDLPAPHVEELKAYRAEV